MRPTPQIGPCARTFRAGGLHPGPRAERSRRRGRRLGPGQRSRHPFLAELAAEYRGRAGGRGRRADGGGLAVSVAFRSGGLVGLVWESRPWPTAIGGWGASVTVWLEAGVQSKPSGAFEALVGIPLTCRGHGTACVGFPDGDHRLLPGGAARGRTPRRAAGLRRAGGAGPGERRDARPVAGGP
ncbi:DUF6228 family protein [Streptomyces sp. I05A-00742]|uniref:DUF6228 family protein n=1 Tax=Streptomyces sp. I05A-00742 TaxID=2732853 RepID=UPI002016C35C|nr:DUF6228 family protein [Streptomyces sp. I05A-00742]